MKKFKLFIKSIDMGGVFGVIFFSLMALFFAVSTVDYYDQSTWDVTFMLVFGIAVFGGCAVIFGTITVKDAVNEYKWRINHE